MASAPKKAAAHATPAPAPVEPAPAPAVEALAAAAAEPVAEIQDSVRSALEKGVVESRAAYVKVKAAADEAASAIETSLNVAKDGVVALNAKALEALRANVDANLDFVKAAFAVKSVSDLVALQGEFVRKQVEALTAQTKELGALAQKAAADATGPIKDQVAKTLKIAG